MVYKRTLNIPTNSRRSFFLWGARQSGKTFLLKHLFPDAYRIDLLNSDRFVELFNSPHTLRGELLALKSKPDLIIIDEVQKIPLLLDEVHWLIENHNMRFGLCGSSARKLKRGHANLLGGRALRYELFPLTAQEIGTDFNLERAFNNGLLANMYIEDNAAPLLRSYVTDYLKEEIAEESLVRSLPKFSRFLDVAALCDTQIINMSNIADDCGVSGPTVREYLQILVDTLLGTYLEAYTKKAKRKVIQAPKFYIFDVGVVNHLARRGNVMFGSHASGPAMENWLFHEIKAYNLYSEKYQKLSYWRLAHHDATEVDFIIGDMEVVIECKATARVGGSHLSSLYEINREYPNIKRSILVCREPRRRVTEEGIEIIPALEFVKELWEGGVF